MILFLSGRLRFSPMGDPLDSNARTPANRLMPDKHWPGGVSVSAQTFKLFLLGAPTLP